MIKKLFEKIFGKFCRCLETPKAFDVAFVPNAFCDEHPKFKHKCPKCQQAIKGE